MTVVIPVSDIIAYSLEILFRYTYCWMEIFSVIFIVHLRSYSVIFIVNIFILAEHYWLTLALFHLCLTQLNERMSRSGDRAGGSGSHHRSRRSSRVETTHIVLLLVEM